MRSSVAGSKGSTQWKRAVRPSSRSGMTGRARTSGGSDEAPAPAGRPREVAAGEGAPGAREQEGGGDEGRVDESAHVPNRLTLFGPGSRLRRRGGGSLRLRDRGVTLVTATAGCGRHALRLRLGGRELGAVRRLRGGTRRLGRGGSGGGRRGRRLGGEHRGGEQADGQQGRSDSLHRQGSSWAASTRHAAGGLRSRLAPGRALTKPRRWARSVRGRNERLDANAVEVSDAHGGRMSAKATRFDAPSPFERVFSRLFGMLVGLGLALPHNYLLQVRGRKSGRLYSTPVDVLEHGGRRFLVAGRGETQGVQIG